MSKRLVCLICFVLVSSFILTNPAQAELVGWWKLDEGSGIIAADSSGNGNDGTLIEGVAGFPEWKTAIGDFRIGSSALEFHGGSAAGEGDLVDCGNSAIFDITDNITFALWVRIDAFTMTYQYVFSKGHNYMILRANDTRFLRVVFNGLDQGDGDDYYAGGTTIPIDDGQWHHVAASYDISTGVVAFYTDGILEESKISSGSIPINDESVCIGRRNQSNRKGTDAIIDDVRLYNHTLSEAEILSIIQDEPFVFASGPSPSDGTLHTETWVNLSWRAGDFAVSHDVYLGDSFEDVNNGTGDTFQGNQAETSLLAGFMGYPFPDGFVPGTTYYWRIDEVNEADPNSPWKGDVWSFSIPPRTAYNPYPTDGAEFVDPKAILSWTGGYGASLHTVYIGDNFDDVNDASGGQFLGTATYTPPDPFEREKIIYWRVDEFDGFETHKGEIWAFTTPGAVGNPEPANGAVDVQINSTLNWTAADNAASHELYFSTDADAVWNATKDSPEYACSRALGAESYDPAALELSNSYAWRVDEVYPTGTIKGLVWTFTTADFIVVDDFEAYNDIEEGQPGSNLVYLTWADGFGVPTNGSTMGYAVPFEPTMETATKHGGQQSAPMAYNNVGAAISEVTRTFTPAQDWTANGVTVLTLWFYGDPTNTPGQLYLKINGLQVNYLEPAANLSQAQWQRWDINLTTVGTNLQNVTSLGIGVQGVGATGTLLLDDIRLYQ